MGRLATRPNYVECKCSITSSGQHHCFLHSLHSGSLPGMIPGLVREWSWRETFLVVGVPILVSMYSSSFLCSCDGHSSGLTTVPQSWFVCP